VFSLEARNALAHRIGVAAISESKSRFGKKTYLRGSPFIMKILFKNLEDTPYAGGEFVEIRIEFPTRQFSTFTREIPALEPGEEKGTDWTGPINAFADGYSLVKAVPLLMGPLLIGPHSGVLDAETAFHRIHVELRRDIYTFIALLVSATSLALLVLERLWYLLLSLTK
jgi:hypothetical protein